MKKDGIQTRNRKLASKTKKKRGSVVDFLSPFVNPHSERYPFTAAYGGISNSHYNGLTATSAACAGSGGTGSYGRYGDFANSTAAMASQYYSGMTSQMTSQFMAAVSSQHSTMQGNSMYSSGGGIDSSAPPSLNQLQSAASIPSSSQLTSSVLSSGTESPSNAVAATSFAAIGPSSMPMTAAMTASVGAAMT